MTMLNESYLQAAPSDSSLLTEQYIEILEKTNQQLGMWTNPYGVLVGILGLFIAVIAIVVSIVLYRQGADYHKKLEQERSERDKDWKNMVRDRIEKVKSVEEKLNVLISEYTEKLKSVGKEDSARIEEAIKQLKEERARLETSIGTASVIPLNYGLGTESLGSTFSFERFHRCSKCSFGFNYSSGSGFLYDYLGTESGAILPMSKRGVKCPSCGNIDEV